MTRGVQCRAGSATQALLSCQAGFGYTHGLKPAEQRYQTEKAGGSAANTSSRKSGYAEDQQQCRGAADELQKARRTAAGGLKQSNAKIQRQHLEELDEQVAEEQVHPQLAPLAWSAG